uniref:Uncharacterized protein n=1 Tax=Cacopsylla melanoneura TaxID=428564 RepID=A0A8D8Y0D5_9HEMI
MFLAQCDKWRLLVETTCFLKEDFRIQAQQNGYHITITFSEEMRKVTEEVGERLNKLDDGRAKFYLYQRLSLAIQRGNAAAIEGSFPSNNKLFDDIDCDVF